MIWMELLVALAVAAFISLAGLRALGGLLEQLAAAQSRQIERIEMNRLRTSLQRAWDQRCSHPFNELPWLEIEGTPDGELTDLTSFRMQTHSSDGHLLRWELVRDQGAWIQRTRTLDTEPSIREQAALHYQGRFRLSIDRLSWLPGEVPGSIHWFMPDALTRDAQDGFAIHRVW
jgi:hypothetical protein